MGRTLRRRHGQQVDLGPRVVSPVTRILRPVGLASELDRAALIGFPEAADLAGPGGTASIVTVYVRTDPAHTAAVQSVIGQTANPSNPSHIAVSRPSDALAARAAADSALTSLLVGLGAVALVSRNEPTRPRAGFP